MVKLEDRQRCQAEAPFTQLVRPASYLTAPCAYLLLNAVILLALPALSDTVRYLVAAMIVTHT